MNKVLRKMIGKNVSKKNRIDVGSASSNINNAESSNTERDPNLRDKASTSRVSIVDIETGNSLENKTGILARLQNKKELMTYEQPTAECCIYRVPNSFRNVKPEAYTPQLISIGPLHRGDERLKGMEEQKWRYFNEFVEEQGPVKIDDLERRIQVKEADIRACYSEKFNEIKSEDFIEMILLDAVFIIKFFQHSNGQSENLKPWMIFDIREDLMLLENQLPLSIIEKIDDQETICIPFLKLATVHFGKYLFLLVGEATGVQRSRHFTDLIRSFMLKGSIERNYTFMSPVKLKYNAVMLRQAGMKFQVTEDKCLVNIKFEKGVLKIPRLEVDHCFERLVRNIMAFEQCVTPFEAYVCNYIMFMDNLIDSAEDVDLLAENRIIHNLLGDDAALSDMMNKLCETIPDTYTCYDDICGEMNAHYENRDNHRKATLKLVYFPNVWRGTATVAAAILLILTLIQAVCSFISLF
ncbi:UPF0481 protein [Salix suchowensis]|nr:UPF0481 protein [Salix suchowensis]